VTDRPDWSPKAWSPISLDLETTTRDPSEARTVQATVLVVDPDTLEPTSQGIDTLVDPEAPIDEGATEVHGITEDDVQGEPTFDEIATQVQQLLAQATHVVAYNGGFDLQILNRQLTEEGHAGVTPGDVQLVDPYPVFREHVTHSLEDAHGYYLGEELEDAHDARADVEGTLRVLQAQLVGRAWPWPNDVEEATKPPSGGQPVDWAGKILQDDEGRLVYGFGKHEGDPVREHLDYARWMLKRDFPPATKDVVREIRERERRRRKRKYEQEASQR
jgi:DNA polymerase-3 subunit epsilon